VVTPHRVRKTHPRGDVTIIQDQVPARELTTYHRIPSTTVARALRDCRNLIMPSRLREAAEVARERGLVLADEYEQVLHALEMTPS
jgi:hypothetical protein